MCFAVHFFCTLFHLSIFFIILFKIFCRWYSIPDFFPEIPGIHRTMYCVNLYDTSDSGEDLNLNDLLKKSATEAAVESLNCELPKVKTQFYKVFMINDALLFLFYFCNWNLFSAASYNILRLFKPRHFRGSCLCKVN